MFPGESTGQARSGGEGAVENALTFPDGPRLELDQLLGQLIGRAREVMATQGRLRGLLRANQLITADLELPAVLTRIVEVARELVGSLYLAESTRGQFSAEDEELTKVLAASAAIAIDNARLYEAARRRQEWLRASATISQQLLSSDVGDGGASLRLIAQHALEVADADVVTVVLPSGDESSLSIAVAVGDQAERLTGLAVPVEGSLSGQVFTNATPLRAACPADHPGLVSVAAGDLDVGPVLVIPLLGSQRTWGVLTTVRRAGRAVFSGDDLDMASSFASQAAIALELAEARAEQQRAAMLDERDRIAADLHDQVIQRLFAAGLSLQSVLGRLDPGPVTNRITETIRNLDETTSQIRTTIFGLHQPPYGGGGVTRARVLDVANELTPALGFTPSVRFTGVLDDAVGPQLGEDVIAVVREALSNVARHAQAHQTEIDILAQEGQLTVRVADDGVGAPTTPSRSSGLRNLRERADRYGGTFSLASREPSGCLLTWTASTA
jgi:signal transduction histidine kinase